MEMLNPSKQQKMEIMEMIERKEMIERIERKVAGLYEATYNSEIDSQEYLRPLAQNCTLPCGGS